MKYAVTLKQPICVDHEATMSQVILCNKFSKGAIAMSFYSDDKADNEDNFIASVNKDNILSIARLR